ncbi:SCO family protein [Brucella sp. H1_1004]|uniref:SCO family protein n=1 Tax=Brucella sp. H1_1004 TaxID=3110109 RepID=UPI0039B5A5AE
MKKLLPILIGLLMVVIVAAASINHYIDKQAAGEPFGGPLKLVTMNGDAFTEQDLRSTPAAVFFGFTHCPEVCPTTLYELDGLMNDLGADRDKLKVYYITVDPRRDTTEIMRTYVSNVSKHIMGVSGTEANIEDAIKSYKIYAAKIPLQDGDYTMDHTASIFLLEKGGRFHDIIKYQEDHDVALQKMRDLIALPNNS